MAHPSSKDRPRAASNDVGRKPFPLPGSLTIDAVDRLLNERREGAPIARLAMRYGVSIDQVCAIMARCGDPLDEARAGELWPVKDHAPPRIPEKATSVRRARASASEIEDRASRVLAAIREINAAGQTAHKGTVSVQTGLNGDRLSRVLTKLRQAGLIRVDGKNSKVRYEIAGETAAATETPATIKTDVVAQTPRPLPVVAASGFALGFAPGIGASYATCRYVIGEVRGPETRYCGEPVAKGSYCAEHHALCYHPVGSLLGRRGRAAARAGEDA